MTIHDLIEAYRAGRITAAEYLARVLALIAAANHPPHTGPRPCV
jgi:hypothetical protein